MAGSTLLIVADPIDSRSNSILQIWRYNKPSWVPTRLRVSDRGIATAIPPDCKTGIPSILVFPLALGSRPVGLAPIVQDPVEQPVASRAIHIFRSSVIHAVSSPVIDVVHTYIILIIYVRVQASSSKPFTVTEMLRRERNRQMLWMGGHPDGLSSGFNVSVLEFDALDDEFN